jgi:serine phosphatase RsbU (regulator of sigma subunit)
VEQPVGEGPRLLLIEDDDGDALIVEELLVDSGEPFQTDRVASIAAAVPLLGKVDCALVDLGLPDAHGLAALQQLRIHAPELAIVVMTGLADRTRGIESMAEGAQDYLVKGEVDGDGLARAIRYAIERRRTERDARLLLLSRQRQEENLRLALGLLPQLQVDGPVAVATRYRPGADATLGGDFYDAWLTGDGRLRAVIGDVCGHGPAEAAVGVALRIAWRTLTLSGADEAETLAVMDSVLRQERDEHEPFVTVCDVTLDLATQELTVRLHGHPSPLLVTPDTRWLGHTSAAPPLGLLDHHVPAPPTSLVLPPGWSLLMVTDGLYEGRVPGGGRLGDDGLAGLVAEHASVDVGSDLVDAVLEDVQALHGGELDDDVAVLWVGDAR